MCLEIVLEPERLGPPCPAHVFPRVDRNSYSSRDATALAKQLVFFPFRWACQTLVRPQCASFWLPIGV